MTAHRGEFDAPFSKPSRRKQGMETSMLEYSQHMRKLNDSRGDAYRYDSRMTRGKGEDHSPPPPLPPPPPHTSRDAPSPEKKASLQYPRHRRPLSFDENDLQRNQKLKLLKQRPYRDTKSERPPVKIPNGLPPIAEPSALGKHSSSSPELDAAHRQKQLRVNLVNASDLYDLVDIRMKDTHHHDSSVKIANPEAGVRLVEEMQWARPHRRPNQLEPLPHHHYNKFAVKPERTAPSSSDPNLLVGKSIKSEFVNPKSNAHKPGRDKAKHDDVYFLDKGRDEGRVLYRNSPDTTKKSSDIEPVLDVFLEQAAAKYKTSRVLKSRPKRAKRMQLHKPDLLSIPEDGGSFIRPQGSSIEASRQEMLSSNNTVPYPSSSSLTAIKEVSPRAKLHESRVHESSFRPADPGAHRKTYDDYKRYNQHARDDIQNNKRSPRTPKYPGESESRSPRDKVDLDSVIMTSIYSGLAIDPEIDHGSKLKHVTLERTSPKERAQKKMKRLIFLRDQPDQNYRREF